VSDRIRAAAIELYDRFTHEGMNRRAFMAELTRIAGGTAAAAALLAGIAADPATAAVVAPNDKRVQGRQMTWRLAGGEMMKGYQAEPRRLAAPLPSVLVIHENRGLNAHIEDVARRLALAGYRALAPDFLSPIGGTPEDQDAARGAIGKLDLTKSNAAAVQTLGLLRSLPGANGQVGAIGFCWGGAFVNRLAVAAGTSLQAGVSYYGPAPAPTEAAKVEAPLLLHLAGNDARVNTTGVPWAEALRAGGKEVEHHIYQGVEHAFNNDTSAERYNKAAAALAWQRSLAFFERHLRA
jgi:carboxymethylenebutenolidase